MLKDFIIKSKFYLMLIFVLFLLFSYVAIYHMDFIMNIDLSINKFISNYVVNDKLNILFKLITNIFSSYVTSN